MSSRIKSPNDHLQGLRALDSSTILRRVDLDQHVSVVRLQKSMHDEGFAVFVSLAGAGEERGT